MNISRLTKAVLAFVIAFLAFGVSMAFAAPPEVTDGNGTAVTGSTLVSVTLSATLVTMLVSYVIPILTAFITQSSASTGLKQFVTALLSAINGLIVGGLVNDGSAALSKESILFAVGSFVLANVSYITFWKPRSLNAKVAPNFGVG